MERLPDHPAIRYAHETGYPDASYLDVPRCPVCGENADILYRNAYHDVVGCGECVYTSDAWETMEDM